MVTHVKRHHLPTIAMKLHGKSRRFHVLSPAKREERKVEGTQEERATPTDESEKGYQGNETNSSTHVWNVSACWFGMHRTPGSKK